MMNSRWFMLGVVLLASGSRASAGDLPFGGRPQAGVVASAGQSNSYTLPANANDVVNLTMVTTSGSLVPKLSVFRPDGTLLAAGHSGEAPIGGGCIGSVLELNTLVLPTSGVYTVIVADCGESHTGAYMISAQRTNNPAAAAMLFFGGQPQPGSITSAAQSNTYTFRGNAKDAVNFTMTTTSGSVVPKLRVYNPDGSLLAVTFSGAGYGCIGNTLQLNATLPVTGAYTALASDCGDTHMGEYNLSAQCVGVCPAAPVVRSGVLAHVASGGGWTTVITLVNVSGSSATVSIAFRGEDGTALNLPVTMTQQGLTQTATTSKVDATLNPNAMWMLSTGEPAGATATGWADVMSSGPVAGYVMFRSTVSGLSGEGAAPLETRYLPSLLLPYDNTGGFIMGAALANLSPVVGNVTATVWDDSGTQLGPQTFTLAASGHTSFVVPSRFPATAGKRGIVRFESNSGGLSGLGLRFGPFGTFTSMPTIPGQ